MEVLGVPGVHEILRYWGSRGPGGPDYPGSLGSAGGPRDSGGSGCPGVPGLGLISLPCPLFMPFERIASAKLLLAADISMMHFCK